MDCCLLLGILFFIIILFIIIYCHLIKNRLSLSLSTLLPIYFGGDDIGDIGDIKDIKPLHVFLDERNFYYYAKKSNNTINNNPHGKSKSETSLKKLKQYLKKRYNRQIIMHIITKNTNGVDFSKELDEYTTRYDTSQTSTDILHIANTVYDTEKISNTRDKHHLRGRDDFLAILLAYEYLDKGNDILIISNDKFRDIPQMYQMPEFNEITMSQGQIINQRHINPSRFRFSALLKRIIDNPNTKISIDSISQNL